MMRVCPLLSTFFALLFMVISCGGSSSVEKVYQGHGVKYARHLSIEEKDGFNVVRVINPWDSMKLLATYILIPRGEELPDSLPQGIILRTPLDGLTVFSSVHSSAFEEMGCRDIIKCVVDAGYFKSPAIASGLKDGSVIDAGNSSSPSIEKILASGSDAILFSVYQGMDVKGIENTGIPLIQLADISESDPLGKAEWIRFLGLLAGKRELADSIFSNTEKEYLSLKEKAKNTLTTPSVLVENMYEGVWYVPGGASYQAAIIRDAGGKYIWDEDTSSGSLSLNFEQVLAKASDADIWLMRLYGVDLSKDRLLDMDSRYRHFRAVDNKGVFYSDTKKKDLFEESAFHPQLLLKDYLLIFHPEKMEPGDSLRYFCIMK